MTVPLEFIRSTFEQDYTPSTISQPISHSFEWDNFYSHSSPADGIHHEYYSQEKREAMLQKTCVDLAKAAGDPAQHFQQMEDIFAALLSCQWRPKDLSEDQIVQQVDSILQRLPDAPAKLPGDPNNLAPEYFTGNDKLWESLRVVSRPQKNFVRIVIYYIISTQEGGYVDLTLQEVLNHVGELIHTCTMNRKPSVNLRLRSSRKSRKSFYLAGAYLWAFWQRARTLFAYIRLRLDLRGGVRHGMEKLYWVQDFSVSRKVSLRTLTDNVALSGKPPNMCGWMLELLRGDPKCLGLDFSVLHSRFRNASKDEPARCRDDSPEGCLGKHWRQCGMFYRKNALPDQTMHDDAEPHTHVQEHRVVWDEASYRSISGPRAVSISSSDEIRLRYCQATERTMAISHVWSHGQGGRPDTGINACLHKRYQRLARANGCDSYWIDAACIPYDDVLRSEAIRHINTIFYTSKCVLVIDIDLMKKDVRNMDTRQHESLLTAVLFSEWNTRAWTMLESLKGRDHVMILGQHDGVIRFMDLLEHVLYHGRIDLAVFALFLPHMTRSQGEESNWIRQSPILRESIPNDIQLEVVGSWLSHRPVSRPRDEVVIWSLCLNQQRQRIREPEDFWRQQRGVNSGFLLSSAPRLTVPGLRWAPQNAGRTTSGTK
ncbi:HET domain protein [Apiospora rasikravindrae]|uniref:HET domain protein n=1 Tax=Apiospora rasikravindrae TaxID=990691 RepID=A0ABR1U0N6_9PEZI